MTDNDETNIRSGSYLGSNASSDPMVIATARLVRRIGYSSLGLFTVAFVVPLVIGVIFGVVDNKIWDPWTGQVVDQKAAIGDPTHFREVSCYGQGIGLISRLNSSSPPNEADIEKWTGVCGEREPKLNRVLTTHQATN